MPLGTAFTGPLQAGSVMGSPPSSPGDYGLVELVQRVTLNQNSTTAVSATMLIPQGSYIYDFAIDTPTAWNSATSATLTIGTVAAGTQYASGVSVLTAGGPRQRPTYTTTQLTNMSNVGANTSVVVTVTPTGATSAGSTTVTMVYIQTVQPTAGTL